MEVPGVIKVFIGGDDALTACSLFSLSFRLQDGTVCSISNIETKDVYGWIPKGDGDLAGWLGV
jgi:hypothetical protein